MKFLSSLHRASSKIMAYYYQLFISSHDMAHIHVRIENAKKTIPTSSQASQGTDGERVNKERR